MKLSPLSRVYIKRIQVCINLVNHTTFEQLLKTFPNTVTRISICYSSCTPEHLSHLTQSLNQNLKVVVGKRAFIYAIKQDDTVNLRSMLFYYLDNYQQDLDGSLTPLQYALMKKPYSIEKLRKQLNTASMSARNTIKAERPRLITLKKYCSIMHLSFKKYAKAYGYRTTSNKKPTLNSLLTRLRISKGLKQLDLAKLLHNRQTEVSRIENGYLVGFNTLIKYIELFHIEPISLLKYLKLYHHLSIHSPGYALIKILCDKQMSINEMAHFIGMSSSELRAIIRKHQSSHDYISEYFANRIVKSLSLPKDTFKGLAQNYYAKEFKEYQHKTDLNEHNFSYRFNKVRCEHHYSLRDIAKHLGCTPEWVEALIYRHRTSTSLRLKMASVFPNQVNYLLNIVKSPI